MSTASALLYLYRNTARNRFRAQIARARNPRYIVAVILGALYLWWALFRNTRYGQGPLAAIVRTDVLLPIISALLLFSAARWWLFGSERSALAFTPPEVDFLFPAPVTRRALVHAKLLRAQFAILINSLIWMVLLRGNGTTAAGWRRGAALWLLFSVLSLHRLGAAIVRANLTEHDHAGRKRSLVPVVVFGAMIAAVAWGVLSRVGELRFASLSGFRAVTTALNDALQQQIPAIALWPVRVLLAPVFASNYGEWLDTVPFSLGMLLLHYLWVVRLDTHFEEAALEATQHRAERLQRFRTSQLGKTRSKKGKLARIPALALTGRPEIAITWKNVAAAIRGGAWRTQLVSFTIGLAFFAVITRSTSARAAEMFTGVAAGWGAMLLFVGPLWMRFDLRLDLQRLTILKTLPLPGHKIVAAEIAGVTLLHSITVWSLMTVPVVMLLQDAELAVQTGASLAILAAIALAIPALNAMMFTIQNGTALLFPAWVRLGSEARGFETMGQNLLTTGATTLVAAVGLVFPIGFAYFVRWILGDFGPWSWLVATIAADLVIFAQLWPVIYWLGTVFEQVDINEVAHGV